MTVLCLWLWLRGGKGRLVVAGLWVFFFLVAVGGCQLRSDKRGRLLGAWIVFFFPSSCYCSLWLWMVGQQWKLLLLLCCVVMTVVMVWFFFFLFPSFVEIFGFGICWCCWCC